MNTEARSAIGWKGLLWRAGRILLIVYLVTLVMMLFLEKSMIFFPSRYPDGFWKPIGLTVEDAWFDASDDTRLHGWFVEHSNPRAVVLFAHGNAGNLTHRVDRLLALHNRFGVSVLIFDYRGYGRSEGSPSEEGILDDARAARRWLAQRVGLKENQIVLMGESLGGGVMVDLAAKDGARGLILESSFTSLPDIAAVHYPWLPARTLMRTRLDSLSKIGNYHGPLLWYHGMADRIIPYDNGRRLFDAANEPKRAVSIEGADHNGPPLPDEYPAYAQALDEFFASLSLGDSQE